MEIKIGQHLRVNFHKLYTTSPDICFFSKLHEKILMRTALNDTRKAENVFLEHGMT